MKKRLADAKQVYESKVKKYEETISDWLDTREDAARKAGDKKKLDDAKADRKAFDDQRILPAGLPVETKKQLLAARVILETAMTAAIKEYTRAKMDDEATVVDQQLQLLRKDSVLLGTWKITMSDYEAEWTFKAGGIVDSSTSGEASGKWVIDTAKGQVVISWKGDMKDKFDLPLNPKKTTGSQVGRNSTKLEAVKLK